MFDTELENFIFIFVILIGLCLGSFYNVVILRSLSNESIVFPPSKCPKCGNRLKPWHNIPILSYLFLGGKCAFCKEKISLQYPIIEFLTCLLFGGIYIKFGLNWTTLFAFFWVSCLIIMTTTDLKEKVADCNIAIAMGISGLLYSFVNTGWIGVRDSVLGILLGIVVIEVIACLGHLLKKGRAMGEADTFVAGAFGAIAGWQSIGLILICSVIISMLFILPKYWIERYKAKDALTLLFSALFIFGISFTNIFRYSILASLFLLISGLGLVFCILKNIKNSSDIKQLPFIPSLTLGFLYFLFFVL